MRVAPLGLSKLHYFTTKSYDIHCNWKVFVDNYLDGGYHVPHLHKGLNSVWITNSTRSRMRADIACNQVRW